MIRPETETDRRRREEDQAERPPTDWTEAMAAQQAREAAASRERAEIGERNRAREAEGRQP